MTTRIVHKMTGSGNDFVVLDGRVHQLADWPASRIVAVCDRRTGIGADGFVLLEPEDADVVRMHFFNADGSRAAMCGNAALCSARLAGRLGLAGGAMTLHTDAGMVPARLAPEGDEAEICLGSFPVPGAAIEIELGPGERRAWLGTVGVPHLVVLVDDVRSVDVAGRGHELRHHSATGPAGANANFVSAPGANGQPWLIRTFERGVEGETLACGTGTVAAAVALAAAGLGTLPMACRSWGGFPLAVSGSLHGGTARSVWLRGQGRLVFTAALAE